jgi:hypothetical protein
MDKHTPIERRLKTDIIRKNLLRKSLQKKLFSVRRWSELLLKSPKNQQKKRYQESIDRYMAQIGFLKKELLKRNETLEKQIQKEMKFSEDEVKAFQAELNKELKALEKIQKELDETSEKEKSARNKNEVQLKKRRLEKMLADESKKMMESEKELISEKRDEALFTLELKRIALEKELYRP